MAPILLLRVSYYISTVPHIHQGLALYHNSVVILMMYHKRRLYGKKIILYLSQVLLKEYQRILWDLCKAAFLLLWSSSWVRLQLLFIAEDSFAKAFRYPFYCS